MTIDYSTIINNKQYWANEYDEVYSDAEELNPLLCKRHGEQMFIDIPNALIYCESCQLEDKIEQMNEDLREVSPK